MINHLDRRLEDEKNVFRAVTQATRKKKNLSQTPNDLFKAATVEPLQHNSHLGDGSKWPLWRGLNNSQCLPSPWTAFPSPFRSIHFGDVSEAHIFAWITWPKTLWPRGIMRPRDQAKTMYGLFTATKNRWPLWRGGGSIDCNPDALLLSCRRLAGAKATKTRECWLG